MVEENTQEETTALGTFLRSQREEKGVSLRDATESTKISVRMLEAIENDDYDALPAEAFSRGFYSMYADFLGLDAEEILARYQESRGGQANSTGVLGKPPTKKGRAFNNYAEPASFSPATIMSITIAAALIAFATACWYLDWNPVTYINTRLQGPTSMPLSEQELIESSLQPLPEAVLEATPQEENPIVDEKRVDAALSPELPTVQNPLEAAPELSEQASEESTLSLPEATDGQRLLSQPEDLPD